MKRLFTISLAVLILLQSFSKLVILLDYQLNKEHIAAVLCENRSTPSLRCEGKCYLNKRLAKSEETDQKTTSTSTIKADVIWLCQSGIQYNFYPVTLRQSLNSFYLTNYHFTFLSGTFHPPRFAV